METANAAVQTEAELLLLKEGLRHFGLDRKDVERHSPRVWSVQDGTLRIETARGPLKYRAGDGDEIVCGSGHTYPRWFGACRQCKHVEKHSADPAVSYAARTWLAKLPIVQRKLRIDSAKNGAAPGSRKPTWGERGVNW